MKAGKHGPVVTLYVVFCLLCLAEKQGAGNTDEVRTSKFTSFFFVALCNSQLLGGRIRRHKGSSRLLLASRL